MTEMLMRGRTATRREFRRFGVSTIEVREKDGTTEIDVTGYASITGEPYPVRDALGEYHETIESGAFRKTLADKDDVKMLLNHDGLPLARTKAGTLTLTEDDHGLKVDATLDTRSSLSNSLVVALERGDIDEMSFMFRATRQEWNDDYSERWVRELKLYDVSVVTYPANPATSVKLRAADFLINNLSADEADDFIRRYTDPRFCPDDRQRSEPKAPMHLRERRAQMATMLKRR